ncbi:MAG: TetR family transcriptional regulator [Candidatus Lokiarchaeota archaeon]|nr:TetR family transcriptional regulator [Candidatus Lokiarchaeota archaeon]
MNKLMDLSAKDRILYTARKMIESQGYNNLNINTLAENAKVAIGTLYWHFKKGKQSIVKELLRQSAEEIQPLLKDFKFEPNKPIKGFKPFLLKYIQSHREHRMLIRAFVIEELEDEADFREFSREEIEKTIHFLKKNLKKYETDIDNFPKKLKTFALFLDDLVHQHIIFNDKYGSDDFLVDILANLFEFILLDG